MKISIVALIVCLALTSPAAGEDPPALETRVFDATAILSSRVDVALDSLGLGLAPTMDESGPGDEEGLDEAIPLDTSEIEEILRTFVSPDAWLVEGASIRWIDETRLAVTAPRAALDGVASMLAGLFAETSRRVDVRADLVTFDAAGVARLETSGALAALARGRLDEATRRAVLAEADRPGASRLEGAVTLRPGRLGRISQTTVRSYVADFDVEIAQGSVVGDPIVRFLTEGWLVHVRPTLLTDGRVWLEALHQTAALRGPIRRVDVETEPHGALDLPAVDVERFFVAARLRSGDTLAVGRRGPDGPRALVALLLTPRVLGEGLGGGTVSFVPLDLLSTPGLGVRAGWSIDAGGEWCEEPLPTLPVLLGVPRMQAVRSPSLRVDGLAWTEEPGRTVVSTGRGLYVGPPAAAALARNRVAALEDRLARGYRIRLTLTAGGVRLGEVRLDAPAGRETFFQAGTERSYLADWDVEVAQEAQVGDPIIGTAFGGLLANLRLDPAPAGDRVAGRLSLALIDLDETFETRRPGIWKVGLIEVPRARQALLERELDLSPGVPVEILAGRHPDGRPLVVTLEIEPR